MKRLSSEVTRKILSFKKRLTALAFTWLNSIKKSFSFHNNHTELLAIWTVLFITITGLFFIAVMSNIFTTILILILAVAIMFAGTIAATFYLHALKYHNSKRILPKTHKLLNKSFKLRSILRFIKIPRISILNNIKNFKLAS